MGCFWMCVSYKFFCSNFITGNLSVEPLSFKLSWTVYYAGSLNVYQKFTFNNRKFNPYFIDGSALYVGFTLHYLVRYWFTKISICYQDIAVPRDLDFKLSVYYSFVFSVSLVTSVMIVYYFQSLSLWFLYFFHWYFLFLFFPLSFIHSLLQQKHSIHIATMTYDFFQGSY